MIRGYNFPSGSEEKVTIDDSKVTEKMDLYSFRNQVTLDVNTPPIIPSGYTYQGELYDGSKLYMKTTLTTITDGSTNSSAGCTGTVLLIKPNGTQLSIAIPTYTIPTERSETGTNPDSYHYSCYLYPSPDGNIYLRLQREFEDIRGSNTFDHWTYYQSIYKLNIYSSSLTWTTKAIEITLGPSVYPKSDFIIEDDYIYVCSSDDGETKYIYGYKFRDTSYTFQKISTNSISGFNGHDSTVFARKGTNTYIYFWTDNLNTLTDNWISITRNSDGTYSEASGTAVLMHYNYRKKYQMFMLNGEIYIQMLGYGGYEGYEGLQYYKLNSDNSKWEIAIDFSKTATSFTTSITNYFNGSPKCIFQGQKSSHDSYPIVRSDGTFDLTVFTPGTLSFKNLQTPTVNNTFDHYTDEWSLYKYIYNDINQKAFFFSVKAPDGGYNGFYPDTRYKCVLEAIDGNPVLYSTFIEDDIIG